MMFRASVEARSETVQKLRQTSSQIESGCPLTHPDLPIVECSAI